MRIVTIEHSRSDGPGKILDWIQLRGHDLHRAHISEGDPLPSQDTFDFLIVMGGVMNIYQYRDHPWLVPEKAFIRSAIDAGKAVLGVCLGGQLMSDVLGGKVTQNPEVELGWWPVQFHQRTGPFARFPENLTVCHWHGDTFTIPLEAIHAASSPGCANQAYYIGDRLVGLQFHIEIAPCHSKELAEDLPPDCGRYVQTGEQLIAAKVDDSALEAALHSMLDALASAVTPAVGAKSCE